MSILTELLHRKIGWAEAKAKAETWAAGLKQSNPALGAAVDETLAIVKQGASDALSLSAKAVSDHIAPAADAVELALDAALAKATGGLSVPFNPIIDSAIDQFADVVKKAADAWALEAKAKLAGHA